MIIRKIYIIVIKYNIVEMVIPIMSKSTPHY